MRQRRIHLWSAAVLVMAATCLTACGSRNMVYYEETAEAGMATDDGAVYTKSAAADTYEAWPEEAAAAEEAGEVMEYPKSNDVAGSEGAAGGGEALPEQTAVEKKLIRNVNLEVETTEFDNLLGNLTSEVAALGGYVENYSSSNYSAEDARTASIVARIPSEALDGFLDKVAQESNVVYRNESVDDVTLQYVDLDTRKKAMIVERDRLLDLLERAETVADIIEIESRLSEINYEIESLEARLRTIDNQVTYSTVYISIYEVKIYTPAAEKSVWDKIADGFGNNVYRVLDDLENLVIGFIISLPYLIVWIVFILILLFAVVLFCRILGKRKTRWAAGRQARRQKAVAAREQDDYEIIPTGNESDGSAAGVKPASAPTGDKEPEQEGKAGPGTGAGKEKDEQNG